MSKGRYRVYIVEDEAYVRDELKFVLGRHAALEIVGEADNALDAVCDIRALKPDAAFLDIKLGDTDGVTLARKLRETDPALKIVFVTAFDHYAVEGFELAAVDYVLKPFSEERLARTVERLLGGKPEEAPPPPIPESAGCDKMMMKKNDVWKLVDVSEIYYFQSGDHVTFAATGSETYQLHQTLRELSLQLPQRRFIRTHKSFIVNVDYIDEVIPWFHYTYKIALKKGKGEIPVSRNYMKHFKSLLMKV